MPERLSHAPAARATLVFRVALAAAVLHAIDTAFLRPNAGTGAADHLLGGLAPVAGALAAALAYPRLPAAWRSLLALTCGVFAAAAGGALMAAPPAPARGFAGPGVFIPRAGGAVQPAPPRR